MHSLPAVHRGLLRANADFKGPVAEALLANALVDFRRHSFCTVPLTISAGGLKQVERIVGFGSQQVADRCLKMRTNVPLDSVRRGPEALMKLSCWAPHW